MEQVKGIKPSSSTWQADILSLNYTHMEPVVSAALTPSVWKTEILVCYTIPTMSFSNSCVLQRKDFHLNRLFYLLITLLNHLFVILMVRVIACNSKTVSFSSICICPEKVYKPKLIFYSISQPNHLHLILYNNFYSLYIVYINFLCFFIFLLAVRVGLTNYTSRTNIYFDCPRDYSTI